MRTFTVVPEKKLAEIVNTSITQTLTRSIYTSFTTFVMVAVLYIMGVSSIREFAAPLMVGVLVGAYSSVCITGALWYVMKKNLQEKDSRQLLQLPHLQSPLQSRRKHVMYHRKIRLSQRRKTEKE